MSAETYAFLIIILNFASFYCFTIYLRDNMSILKHVLISMLGVITTGAWVYVNFVLNLVPIFWEGAHSTKLFNEIHRGFFLGFCIWLMLIMVITGITAFVCFLALLQHYRPPAQ